MIRLLSLEGTYQQFNRTSCQLELLKLQLTIRLDKFLTLEDLTAWNMS